MTAHGSIGSHRMAYGSPQHPAMAVHPRTTRLQSQDESNIAAHKTDSCELRKRAWEAPIGSVRELSLEEEGSGKRRAHLEAYGSAGRLRNGSMGEREKDDGSVESKRKKQAVKEVRWKQRSRE